MGLLDDAGLIAGAGANPYGLPGQGQWALTQGSFETKDGTIVIFWFDKTQSSLSALFPIFGSSGHDASQKTGMDQIHDSGGRRLVVYEYPYKDGQRVKNLGRKGETFVFSLMFYGPNYQTLFNRFITVVANTNASGTLTHPVRGPISCAFHSWEFTHSHDKFNAVSIRATFVEDNTGEIADLNNIPTSPNSSLRNTLQTINDVKASIGNAITVVGAALLLPGAILAGSRASLNGVINGVSGLLGKLAATFSSDSQLQSLAAIAFANQIPITSLTGGSGLNAAALAPVYQIGFSEQDSATMQTQLSNFVNANQVTVQQVVFQSNTIRKQITDAIADIELNYGNDGYDMVVQYRYLATQIQAAAEASIAAANSKIKKYTVPFDMSVRLIAFNNGLTVDRQNDIAGLNPDLESLNFVAKGTIVTVPAA